jgi:hypothetical protein
MIVAVVDWRSCAERIALREHSFELRGGVASSGRVQAAKAAWVLVGPSTCVILAMLAAVTDATFAKTTNYKLVHSSDRPLE